MAHYTRQALLKGQCKLDFITAVQQFRLTSCLHALSAHPLYTIAALPDGAFALC